jgi:hypothetical protein
LDVGREGEELSKKKAAIQGLDGGMAKGDAITSCT